MSDSRHGTKLGAVLWAWRTLERLSIREAAQIVGVSSATWSRLEGGRHPDVETWLLLQTWLLQRVE